MTADHMPYNASDAGKHVHMCVHVVASDIKLRASFPWLHRRHAVSTRVFGRDTLPDESLDWTTNTQTKRYRLNDRM